MALLWNNYENNMKINAVSGTLTKTYKDSYFARFQIGSNMEANYLNDKYRFRYNQNNNSKIEIVVLQVMLCGDNTFLVEAIDKKDYDKLFEGENKNGKD